MKAYALKIDSVLIAESSEAIVLARKAKKILKGGQEAHVYNQKEVLVGKSCDFRLKSLKETDDAN